MKARQITFTAPGVAELLAIDVPEPRKDQVLVKTAYSVVSAGTERANLMGQKHTSPGYIDDSVLPRFPKVLGYCGVGIVEKTGPEVKQVKPGDRVIIYFGTHASYNLVPEEKVIRIDDDAAELLPLSPAVIAQIAMSGVRMARIELGESALIMGLGILGLYAVQWCRMAGACPVIVADPNPERRAKALEFGADDALDPTAEDFAQRVKALTGGGVNAVIEVSGAPVALVQALECTARMARVVLLGCTRENDRAIDFYHMVHFRGVQILGAHTSVRPAGDSCPGYWTYRDELKALLKLVSGKRIDLMRNIQEVHRAGEAPAVYARLAQNRDFPVGVVFDWGDE